MINTDKKYLLFIEPTSKKMEPDCNDEITQYLEAKMKKSKPRNDFTKGWHSCSCKKAHSDNCTYSVSLGGTPYITNTLAVHYIKNHRSEVPETELEKIKQAMILDNFKSNSVSRETSLQKTSTKSKITNSSNDTLSKKIGDFLKENNLILTTAESCTAGMISSMVADTPGSSGWLDRAFIVYTPTAKNEVLNVSFETIEKYNITSEEVAKEMAIGALKNSLANFSVSTTGVAGPTGGTDEIPVGTVCFAWSYSKGTKQITLTETKHFTGTRNEIREKAAKHALKQIPLVFKKHMEKLHKEEIKIGDFVTANIQGKHNSIQGVCAKIERDKNTIIVIGESNTIYHCYYNKTTIIPDNNLCGSTKTFVNDFRNKENPFQIEEEITKALPKTVNRKKTKL